MIQEKIQKKAEGFGKLAPAFLEGAKFALENLVEDNMPCNKIDITIDKELPKSIEERWRLIDRMAAEQSTSRLSKYRESVASCSDLEVQKFFNNPYLINVMGCCLVYGAKWSDANPYLKWTKYSDREPIVNEEVIAFNKKWIDEDLNPNGTRVGFLNLDGKFIFACKSDKEDCYETINSNIDNTEPEYWLCISDLIHDVLNKHNEIREVNLMEK